MSLRFARSIDSATGESGGNVSGITVGRARANRGCFYAGRASKAFGLAHSIDFVCLRI